jgi:methyl-accepting chemotaxis protein
MNKDIAFLYIMRRINNRVVFVIDSDESDRQALPGKEYTEVIPALIDGFTGIAVDDKIYQDEWGAFLSGYAPIQNGMGEFLVGMDMHADDVEAKFRELRISGWISLSASIILALFFSRFLSRRFMTPIQILIERCNAIAKGRLDERIVIQTNDELEHLVQAFNSMSVSLASSERNQQQAFQDLRRARDELGIRVEQRTQDLKEVNERLSREIAERIRAEQALEVAALTDPLTGLHNRRAISDHLRHQAIQCEREKSEFAVLLADLDSFKVSMIPMDMVLEI